MQIIEIDPRDIQALAQSQYEASNPTGVPWSARCFSIRQGWVDAARRQLLQQSRSGLRQAAE
jgi:hypothetical protein